MYKKMCNQLLIQNVHSQCKDAIDL